MSAGGTADRLGILAVTAERQAIARPAGATAARLQRMARFPRTFPRLSRHDFDFYLACCPGTAKACPDQGVAATYIQPYAKPVNESGADDSTGSGTG